MLLSMYKGIVTPSSSTLTNPFSRFSKLLTFCSLQRHHIKHEGPNLHNFKVVWFPICPLQLTNNSLTLQVKTQSTLTNWKSALYNSFVTSQ